LLEGLNGAFGFAVHVDRGIRIHFETALYVALIPHDQFPTQVLLVAVILAPMPWGSVIPIDCLFEIVGGIAFFEAGPS
jgi:hypothetical protein